MSTVQPFPQVGDKWEFRLPDKPKKIKIVGSVHPEGVYGNGIPRVSWQRRNKGRYTGLNIDTLHKYGKRLSTKAERDKHFKDQVNANRKRLGKAPLESLE